MENNRSISGIHGKKWLAPVARAAAASLLTVSGVAVVQAGTPTGAEAANACFLGNYNALGDSEVNRSGSTGDTRYPATLHGKTVHLYTNVANASVVATVDGASTGDVVSIDRSVFRVSGTADHYFKTTAQIQALGTWDYCEKTATSSGKLTSKRIDGAHHYVRVCLRHSGALQCTNVWYGDNDDEAGDISRRPGDTTP